MVRSKLNAVWMVIGIVAVTASVHAAGPSALSIVSGPIDLGSVSPTADNTDASVAPQTAVVQLLVQSATPWSVVASLDPDSSAPDLRPLSSADAVEIRMPGREWLPVRYSLSTPLASGGETPDRGSFVSCEVRVSSTLDALPGRRRLRLYFAIVGQPDRATTTVTYVVPVVAQINEDSRPFASPSINPARSGLYPYEARTYQASSNVPWVLEATLAAPAVARGRSDELPESTIVVIDSSGSVRPLVPKEPLVIAAGDATGQHPRPVQFQLAVKVDDRVLVGGDYSTQVLVAIRPANSPVAHSAGTLLMR